jgi:hypothetical protein
LLLRTAGGRSAAPNGYGPGTSVLIEELEGGELRIRPAEQVSRRIRGIGRRVASEHSESIHRHDRSPATYV